MRMSEAPPPTLDKAAVRFQVLSVQRVQHATDPWHELGHRRVGLGSHHLVAGPYGQVIQGKNADEPLVSVEDQ